MTSGASVCDLARPIKQIFRPGSGGAAQPAAVRQRLTAIRHQERTVAHLVQDLHFAVRSFRRTPGAAALAVATLAIGIGANAAIFSVIHRVLLDPLPYGRSERLALAWRQNPSVGGVQVSPSREDAERWRTATTLEGVTIYSAQSFTLADGAEPEQVVARTIEPNLFDFLGVRPTLGRPFRADDIASPAAARVVLLGDQVWKRRFGRDPAVLGRTIALSDQPYVVIGVMPPRFRLPLGKGDIWVPLVPRAAGAKAPAGANALVRMKRGVATTDVEAELTAKMAGGEMRGVPGRWQAHLMLPGELAGPSFRRALMVLLGAVGFVLLIGCANIAALLLARNAGRTREIAVRVSLGATRGRLVRQMLTESLLLSVVGGGAGLVLGVWILSALSAIRPAQMEQLADLTLSPQMFAVAAALAVLTGLLFGVAPALAGTRVSLTGGLQQSSRLMSHREGSMARRALTVAEVALACILLVGAALLIRSYGRMVAASPGFEPEHRIALRVALPDARYATPAARADFFARLLAQTQALPGVQSVALAGGVPPNGGLIFGSIEIEGQPPAPSPAAFGGGTVGAGFFRTLGVRVIEGREFVDSDRAASPVIVNESAAKRWWPGQSALGKRLRFGPRAPWQSVLGVVADIKTSATFGDVQIYDLLRPQNTENNTSLVASTIGDPTAIAGVLKGQVWSIDSRVPVTEIETLTQAMSASMSRPRFNVVLLSAFALIGLLLAAIGIYGVIGYSVGQRTREIGLRMALGALPRDIRRSIVGEVLLLAGIGLAIGVAGALLLTRVMSSMLFEVSPADPVSFAVTVAALASTAIAAGWVPAQRAMRVDPMVALRAD
jgi:putative ABC transport system permease protein